MDSKETFSMAEITEPAAKKAKTTDKIDIDTFISNIVNSKNNLQPILSDDFYKPLPLTEVYVGQVKDITHVSKVISVLHEKIPLKELSHLKRARKQEIILCPVYFLSSSVLEKSIQEYIEENVNELKDSFDYFKVLNVPLTPPKIRRQLAECGKMWSLNFHPNKYLESLCSGNFFDEKSVQSHRLYMGIAFEVAKWHLSKTNSNLELSNILLSDINATVIVDPYYQSIVTVAFDNRQEHPLQHSAMLAIDNVARTQNGGAWSALEKDVVLYLNNKYRNVKFGARNYSKLNASGVNNSPYLCTGYYVYLLREPCVMCAMGLVHARAKRVFFCFKNSFQGALCSKAKLQCIPSLNHHFEVFTDFL